MDKGSMIIGWLGMCIWSMGGLAVAPVVNGDFAAGLTGWTTANNGNIAAPLLSVTAVAGEAVLATQGIASGVTLIALLPGLTIPALTSMLRFDINFAQGHADGQSPAPFVIHDHVQVSYGDATNFVLFLGLNVNGPYNPSTHNPVTLRPLGNGLCHFTTPIGRLAGLAGTFSFDLFDQDDGFVSQVRVCNVEIQASTVPEPGTLLLLNSGLLDLGCLIWWCSRWRGAC